MLDYKLPIFLFLIFSEKGEVLSDHYKLLPVDLCNINNLNDIIMLADMDPRYVVRVNN